MARRGLPIHDSGRRRPHAHPTGMVRGRWGIRSGLHPCAATGVHSRIRDGTDIRFHSRHRRGCAGRPDGRQNGVDGERVARRKMDGSGRRGEHTASGRQDRPTRTRVLQTPRGPTDPPSRLDGGPTGGNTQVRGHRERALQTGRPHRGGIRRYSRRRHHHGCRVLRRRASDRSTGMREDRRGETTGARTTRTHGGTDVAVARARAAAAGPRDGDHLGTRGGGARRGSRPSYQHAGDGTGARGRREQDSQRVLEMGMAAEPASARVARMEPDLDPRHAHGGGHHRSMAAVPADREDSHARERNRQRSRGRARGQLPHARRPRRRGRADLGKEGAHVRQTTRQARRYAAQALSRRQRRMAQRKGTGGVSRPRRAHRRGTQDRGETHDGGGPRIQDSAATATTRRT